MKNFIVLIAITVLATFLRFWELDDLYYFIGDQGWYFLSARDLLSWQVPLVGITASYTWLHQGAIWTYMLAPFLYLFNYDPIGGAILSSILGVLSVIAIYYLGKELFASERLGLIAAILFAVSPLAIYFARMPYHISPMPLAVIILVFALSKYLKGKDRGLIMASFMLGLLYGFELATMALWALFLIVIIKHKKVNIKLFFLSFFTFLIPILPMALYDFQEGTKFYHLTAFLRIIKLSIFDNSGFNLSTYIDLAKKLLEYNQKLIFINSFILSSLILIASLVFTMHEFIGSGIKKAHNGLFLLITWLLFSTLGLLFSKHASEAYLPIILPGIILLISYGFNWIIDKNYKFKPIIYSFIALIVLSNINFIISSSFYLQYLKTPTQKQRIDAAKKIISVSDKKDLQLISSGEAKEFENNLKNYEYLIWWIGKVNTDKKSNSKFVIKEENEVIYIIHEK